MRPARILASTIALSMLAVGAPASAQGSDTLPGAAAGAEAIQRVPANVFLPAPGVPTAPASLVVRPASPAELTAVNERLHGAGIMLATGVGVSVAGLALVAGSASSLMFAGGLVAGAIVLVPLSIGTYAFEHQQATGIRVALAPETFITELRAALPAGVPPPAAALQVDVLILDFGLAPRDAADPRDVLCLVADVAIEVRQEGAMIHSETLHVQPRVRSEDAPAPFCRRYERWGRRDAEALVAARQDLARTLGRMVRARLEGIQWSP